MVANFKEEEKEVLINKHGEEVGTLRLARHKSWEASKEIFKRKNNTQ